MRVATVCLLLAVVGSGGRAGAMARARWLELATATPLYSAQADLPPSLAPAPAAAATLTVTPSVTPTATAGPLRQEAEDGIIQAPVAIASDPAASQGAYVFSPVSYAGWVDLQFQVDVEAQYEVWGRASADAYGSDTFWVQVDGGRQATWDIPIAPWAWVPVTHREFDEPPVVQVYALGAGPHWIRVLAREAGARLDVLELRLATPSATLTPAQNNTLTPTPTTSATPGATWTTVPTATPTPTASATWTTVPTDTPAPTASGTPTPTSVPASTPTPLAGQIAGQVWDDLNGDGILQDTAEPGLAGATVYLFHYDDLSVPVRPPVTTAANGLFVFAELPPGQYTLVRANPPGYLSTTGDLTDIALASGATVRVTFGAWRYATATATATPVPTPTATPTTTTVPTATVPAPTPTATPEGDLTLTGRVFDANAGPSGAIAGATVAVVLCVPAEFEATTDANGQYSLLLPGLFLRQCVSVQLQASAVGYQAQAFPVAISQLRANPVQDFALLPQQAPTVTATATATAKPTRTPSPTLTPTPGPHVIRLPIVFRSIPPTPTPVPTWTRTPTPVPGWVDIVREGFEGSFPAPGWNRWSSGAHNWGPRDCRPHSGGKSAWVVGQGSASQLPCGSDYPTSYAADLYYGPFSLQGATAARLTFWTWSLTEYEYDTCFFGASADGEHFGGWERSGKADSWQNRELDLSAVPYVGNLLGSPQVWIGFLFDSDSTITRAEGWYIDDVSISKWVGGQSTAAPEHPPATTAAGRPAFRYLPRR